MSRSSRPLGLAGRHGSAPSAGDDDGAENLEEGLDPGRPEREQAVRLYLPRQLISYSPHVFGPPSSEYGPGVQPATERLLTLLAEGLHPVTHWAWVNHARHGPILLPNTGDHRQGCVVWYPPL